MITAINTDIIKDPQQEAELRPGFQPNGSFHSRQPIAAISIKLKHCVLNVDGTQHASVCMSISGMSWQKKVSLSPMSNLSPRSVAAFALNFGRFVSVPPTDLAVIRLSELLQRVLSSIKHFCLRAPTSPPPHYFKHNICKWKSELLLQELNLKYRDFVFTSTKVPSSLSHISLCHEAVSVLQPPFHWKVFPLQLGPTVHL